MRFRSESGYFLGILGLLLAVLIVAWLASIALKTYFAPRPEIMNRTSEAAGVPLDGTGGAVQYQGVIDQTRAATQALSRRSQEQTDAALNAF